MKKLICGFLAAALMVCPVFADGVNVKVNNKAIDVSGVIVDGRTLVPVRGVFEELGYTVDYNADTKTAVISNGDKTIKMTQGESFFTVNDESITPDVPQQIIDGRFMLPLRAAGEAVGARVNWSQESKTAYIQTSGLTVMDVYIPQ